VEKGLEGVALELLLHEIFLGDFNFLLCQVVPVVEELVPFQVAQLVLVLLCQVVVGRVLLHQSIRTGVPLVLVLMKELLSQLLVDLFGALREQRTEGTLLKVVFDSLLLVLTTIVRRYPSLILLVIN